MNPLTGKWSQWSTPTACSATCDGYTPGVQTRYPECNHWKSIRRLGRWQWSQSVAGLLDSSTNLSFGSATFKITWHRKFLSVKPVAHSLLCKQLIFWHHPFYYVALVSAESPNFCSTSLPLARTTRVWWAFSSHYPLYYMQGSWLTPATWTIFSLKKIGRAGNQTRGSWI